MMKKIKFFTLLVATLMCSYSCDVDSCINKTYFTKSYDRFMENVFENHEKFDRTDWESKDKKIKSFINDCYSSFGEELTTEEKTAFWTKYVKFMLLEYKGRFWEAISEANDHTNVDILNEIEQSIDEDSISELFKGFVGDDIENAVDNFLDEMNQLGDKFKKWLNNK